MDSSVPIQAVTILLLVLLSAFFSSAETSMTAANRIRIHSLAEQGDKRAITLEKVISNSGKMLSTILIGNNIVNIAASSLATTFTMKVFGNMYIGIATGVMTLLVLLFGEITPKTIATLKADDLALSYARPIYALMTVLTPIIYIVDKLAGGILFILRVDPNAKTNIITEHELRSIVNAGQENGVIEREEKQMIYNVFDFGDSAAKDVMIPRIDMTFIDVNSTYQELMDIFKEDMHTRFPVYEDNTDNVIGIINIKDLLLYPDKEPFSIRKILREPYFTYEYKRTTDLMMEMRKASVNLAIVLDEYGSTAGLVTLEDLLEEIVGEIRDEYDEDEEEPIREIQPGREYIVLGSAKLDDINEALGTHLESDDYDSVGGYIIEQLDCLPREGESVTLEDGMHLVVDELDKNRIELVHIWLPEHQETAEDTEA
nr:hemolysin family protein [uncultured Blautia sp.]